MKPIDGMTYVAVDLGDEYEISWHSDSRDEWASVLVFVRGLPHRRFDPKTKKWRVKKDADSIAALRASGWLDENGNPKTENQKSKNEKSKNENPNPDGADVRSRGKVDISSKSRNLWRVPSRFRNAYMAEERVPTRDPREVQREAIDAVTLDPSRPILMNLRQYQVDFLRFAEGRGGRVALGDEMGTGKTVQALAWLAYSDDLPALIVVNAPTKLQWVGEYRKWLSSVKNMNTRVQVLKGQTPYRIDPTATAVINWDILSYWCDYLLKCGFRCIVGDEAQAIGNPKSKRSKAFVKLAERIPHVITMSGTPARSKPSQFWTMLHVTDPSLFPSYEEYLYRYCDPKWTPWSALPQFSGADRVKELHGLISKCMLRRTKSEVMQFLPPKTMQVVPLEADESCMGEYRSMEADIGVGDSKREMREHIASLLHSAYALKEKALVSWVEDFLASGEKLLLFAWHRDVVDTLYDAFKDYKPARIYGGLTDKVREGEKRKFISDSECRICVCNIQAGGVGIDGFQDVCSNVAFAEFSHTPTDMRQAEDRLHRGGQGRPVTAYYLVATGTIDEEAIEVLDDRAKMLDGVLDGKEACDIDLLTELLARHGVV